MSDIIHICEDGESLAATTRDWLVDLIQSHCADSDQLFSLALSGGSTPKRLYQLLSDLPEATIDWSRVLLLWGDERNVPDDHVDSNFRMVRESLLDHIDIPDQNVLAVRDPGSPPATVAKQYESVLTNRIGTSIDCVLLGIGDDVHTASLFPGTTALKERKRNVIENRVEKLDCWRITLTAPYINRARNVAFLISGTGKQSALHTLWHAVRDPERFPAQLIRPSGQLWYWIDKPALGTTDIPSHAVVR